MPIRDPTPDPGLFGPDSITWVVMREPRLLLAAGRALLLQAANPLVAQGAIEHSTYKSDPYGRLERTVRWVTVVCFGTTGEAERVSGGVERAAPAGDRNPARGCTRRVPGGTRYSAGDPALLRWVHASFVDTMLVAHDALVGGLSGGAGHLRPRMGRGRPAHGSVPEPMLAGRRRAAAVRGQEVRRGQALPGAGSREVAETVLHPPVGSPLLRPGMDTLAFIATGLLPRELRRGYGSRWTPAHGAAFPALTGSLRRQRRRCPGACAFLRYTTWHWPAPRAAGRTRGQPEHSAPSLSRVIFAHEASPPIGESVPYDLRPGAEERQWTFVVTRRRT